MLGACILGLITFAFVTGLMVKQNHYRSLQRLGPTSRASANEHVFTRQYLPFDSHLFQALRGHTYLDSEYLGETRSLLFTAFMGNHVSSHCCLSNAVKLSGADEQTP